MEQYPQQTCTWPDYEIHVTRTCMTINKIARKLSCVIIVLLQLANNERAISRQAIAPNLEIKMWSIKKHRVEVQHSQVTPILATIRALL